MQLDARARTIVDSEHRRSRNVASCQVEEVAFLPEGEFAVGIVSIADSFGDKVDYMRLSAKYTH